MPGSGTLSYAPISGAAATKLYSSTDTNFTTEQSLVVAGGAIYWQEANVNACPPVYNIWGIAAP
jgi:hypothetical protein